MNWVDFAGRVLLVPVLLWRAPLGAGAEVFPPLVGAASALLLVALALWPHLPRSRRGPQSCHGAT